MRVTVTGASGLVGASLVRALLAAGHRVTALQRGPGPALAGLDLALAPGDVRDPEAVARGVEGAEAVFHLAARVTIQGDRDGAGWAVNVEGTGNVARACLRAGVRRLVHLSSVEALDPAPPDRPLDEGRPLLAARDGYAASKAAAERAVADAVREGLDAVVVSPTAVLGPHDHRPSALGGVVLRIARGRLPALVDAGYDLVDARDVAAGALAALARGRRGERYLLAGRWAHLRELAEAVAAAAGVRPPRLAAPLWLAGLAVPVAAALGRATGEPPHLTRAALSTLRASHRDVRHDKAARELGWAPRPLAETVADTVAWFREAGLLGPPGRWR
jgi:dihydroflavonol-4-reductase